jgi:calcium-dependent protein kinase
MSAKGKDDASGNKVSPGDSGNGYFGGKGGGSNEITLSKKTFVSVHNAENIRDDYLIGKILGSGAFGEVRLCTHRKTGAKRAVKIIKKSFLQGKEETRFLQEIEILKTMDHPNIVRLFEVYQDPKRYFIVTEHCSGGELFD